MHEQRSEQRSLWRGVLDALTGVPLFATAPLYRRWHLRWGSTDAEVEAAMPGDELVPQAQFSATRAITINAVPERVWPWIVQIGYGRAGFYTYPLLDNAGYPSPLTILPQHQKVAVGDWVPMAKRVNDRTAFKVAGFDTDRWLLWAKPDSTWCWKLELMDGGRTRLLVRLKQHYRWRTPVRAAATLVLLEFGDFAMMRRLLAGIKTRAEIATG